MSYRRDQRSSRASLFDDIEEGGLRTSSRDIDERDNDKAIDSLHDRVSYLKRLTGDIHEEVESHNRILSQIGNGMDSTRGIMAGTMGRFKAVFEKKAHRRMCKLVVCFVISFLAICYFIRQVSLP
ncbi:OLC1v1019795C1 [Oldenlandia corymbosa var. corymbosa]|uniref:OLC1v1019795C1 n=1 Tax=Oldenlandia corymbosa var. corymbosa TaxID=529605 RepID=A0AAV1EEZ1_OLDCO|nr:OLC1v1019795C1 [Oldenlandia corymbosa var. corymbosa]